MSIISKKNAGDAQLVVVSWVRIVGRVIESVNGIEIGHVDRRCQIENGFDLHFDPIFLIQIFDHVIASVNSIFFENHFVNGAAAVIDYESDFGFAIDD